MDKVAGARKVLLEAVAIFAGVAIALAADDWRETRDDRREARASLTQMLDDLKADSASYSGAADTYARITADVAWIVDGWHRSNRDVDSLEAAFATFTGGRQARSQRSAFDALESTNGLRLIDNAALRSSIVRYYQQEQTFADFWSERTLEMWEQWQIALAPHVEYSGGAEPGRLWPPRQPPVRMRHDWTSVAADTELYMRLVFNGRYFNNAADLFEGASISASSLMEAIRSDMERD